MGGPSKPVKDHLVEKSRWPRLNTTSEITTMKTNLCCEKIVSKSREMARSDLNSGGKGFQGPMLEREVGRGGTHHIKKAKLRIFVCITFCLLTSKLLSLDSSQVFHGHL